MYLKLSKLLEIIEFINKNIKPNCKCVVAFVNPDYNTNIK